MVQVAAAAHGAEATTGSKVEIPRTVSRAPLTAAALPALMSVPPSVDVAPYRYPILQFIVDWNLSDEPADLIAEAPVYEGDDPILLPAIAVVVHALADRAGLPIPEWVFDHRAPSDVVLFVLNPDGKYARWLKRRSHPLSTYHRVHIHPRMLDKGTPDWWLPWD